MIEQFPVIKNERVLSVGVFSDDDVTVGTSVGEHAAYRIVIKTDKRELVIEGNHDGGPECFQDGIDLYKVNQFT